MPPASWALFLSTSVGMLLMGSSANVKGKVRLPAEYPEERC